MCSVCMSRLEAPLLCTFKLPVAEKQESMADAIHLCISDFMLVLERFECVSELTENY